MTVAKDDRRTGSILGQDGTRSSPGPRVPQYERLMSVSFRHAYYNRRGGACVDLVARPTDASRRLMHALGLLFRPEPAGFAVLYDTDRSEALTTYLRRSSRKTRPTDEFWSRLSFILTARTASFVGITDIPIDLDLSNRNFYFANLTAHLTSDGTISLTPERHVTGKSLVGLVASQVAIDVPPEYSGVAVRSISGAIVLHEPRCVPRPPQELGSARSDKSPVIDVDLCRDVIELDLSALPQDKYGIGYLAETGEMPAPRQYLYTALVPTPFAFIDLLFAKPTLSVAGIYPIDALADVGRVTIRPVAYALSFEARATFWNYYIVPQAQREGFEHLGIESLAPGPKATFLGPCRVLLPNGAEAYRFVSKRPMRLRQQSPYRLRLRGRRSGRSADDDVLIDRLPAANDEVQPMTRSMVRAQLASTLCPGAEHRAGCRDLVRHLCGESRVGTEAAQIAVSHSHDESLAARAPPYVRGAAVRTRGYSDIYVYV